MQRESAARDGSAAGGASADARGRSTPVATGCIWLAILVVGIPVLLLGWMFTVMHIRVSGEERQRRAIAAAIEDLGGIPSFHGDSGWLDAEFDNPDDSTVGNLLPFSSDDPTKLFRPHSLRLGNDRTVSRLTDRGMKRMGDLRGISCLDMRNLQIGDAGLADLPSLSDLVIINCDISDKGLGRVSQMPYLRRLFLADLRVTGEFLRHTSGLGKLETIVLDGNPIDDDALKHLVGHTGLHSLSLGRTPITAAAIEHVANIRGLGYLTLSDTAVDDEALKPLRGMPRLRKVTLDGTHVTEAGIRELVSGRPRLVVWFDGRSYRATDP
jgi:hypothetical protein